MSHKNFDSDRWMTMELTDFSHLQLPGGRHFVFEGYKLRFLREKLFPYPTGNWYNELTSRNPLNKKYSQNFEIVAAESNEDSDIAHTLFYVGITYILYMHMHTCLKTENTYLTIRYTFYSSEYNFFRLF